MCGVADYTTRLVDAFDATGIETVVEYLDGFSLNTVMALRRKYGKSHETVLHLQYPSLHMGQSMSPALLPLIFRNVFVTLHEFRIFSLPRKLIFLPHSLLAKRIIFSSEEERAIFAGTYPWSKAKLSVLPIGNNIPMMAERKVRGDRFRLVYFGQISRDKGIDIFIETVKRLKSADAPVDAAMIGALVEGHTEIARLVRDAEKDLGVELVLNQPSHVVSEELANSDMALLPFPNGATDKRGSALACLSHGVTLLTNHGSETPGWLKAVSYSTPDAEKACETALKLIDGTLPWIPAAETLAHEMSARSWDAIARAHADLYRQSMQRS